MLERVGELWAQQRRERDSRRLAEELLRADGQRGGARRRAVVRGSARSAAGSARLGRRSQRSTLHADAWTLAGAPANPILDGLYGEAAAGGRTLSATQHARQTGADRLHRDFTRLLVVPPQRLCCSPLDSGARFVDGAATYVERPSAVQLEEYVWHCLRMLAHCVRLERHVEEHGALADEGAHELPHKILGNHVEVRASARARRAPAPRPRPLSLLSLSLSLSPAVSLPHSERTRSAFSSAKCSTSSSAPRSSATRGSATSLRR